MLLAYRAMDKLSMDNTSVARLYLYSTTTSDNIEGEEGGGYLEEDILMACRHSVGMERGHDMLEQICRGRGQRTTIQLMQLSGCDPRLERRGWMRKPVPKLMPPRRRRRTSIDSM